MTTQDLPTDSVLQRHAMTELNRILGLPPTDSVLRRHYEQLCAVPTMGTAPASSPATMQAQGTSRSAESSPARGGVMGWLRRIFGA